MLMINRVNLALSLINLNYLFLVNQRGVLLTDGAIFIDSLGCISHFYFILRYLIKN